MKAKILVIDDEESIRYTFKTFLSDEGYSVSTAKNYDEAVALIKQTDFDVIFVDIILGDKSGIDVLSEVRKRNIHCPVNVITGQPKIDTVADAVRLGAFEYIVKPVFQETLLYAAHRALQYKTLQDEKEKYRSNLEAIFRSVREAIITVDKELVVLEVNEAAKDICGYSRDVIGKNFRSLSKKCNGTCLEALLKILKEKEPVEVYRLECHRQDRPQQVVSLDTSLLMDSLGEFSGAVLVVNDVTRLDDLERGLRDRRQFHDIIGQNEKMQKIYSLIEDLADVQTTVLITGESGTGKEMVAEALHYRGARGHKPLVKVNCSALSETLLESELFGHVKGAFTGAVKDRIGRFQRADGGTIFLDEIGDLSPRIQLRLLRVLQEMEFERVGESSPIKVDVRVVAATNQDMSKKVSIGEFRRDLYYRLKVVEVELPPLRDRREDLPLLVNHFLQSFNSKFNKHIMAVSEDVKKNFMDYPWPGNIRELEHVLEHAFILCRQDTITTHHLPRYFTDYLKGKTPFPGEEDAIGPQALLAALKKTGWNKSKAARFLGVNVRTIYRKIEKYKIMKEEI